MIEFLDHLADPRLALYRNVKDRELARSGELFIAEGELVVRRLLRSDFPVLSVLCAARKLERLRGELRDDLPVYVVPDALVNEIVGFQFHTGVMAVGRRKPPQALEATVPLEKARLTLVVCPETNNLENIGTLIRISAAFSADAVLLGEECADPFYRQAIRVSMGNCFLLPLHRSADLAADLVSLKRHHGVQMIATVCEATASPLATAMRPEKIAVLFGSEATGLSPVYTGLCDRLITIPMPAHTDSLNVAISAGIFLYHFSQLT